MSGIFGIFRKDGAPIAVNVINAMQAAMAHWGPDGQAVWSGGPAHNTIALGHLMLHNTPESLAEQLPTSHPECHELVITADVRLDNRTALLAALNLAQTEHAPITDSQLLLHAYARWGEACPVHLVGAYAFVIWDGRQRQLFCARDHMGFCPFYYCDRPAMFVFASDLKALLAVAEVPRRLDEAAIQAARYLGARELKARTLFQDIAKLLPAHTLTVHMAKQRMQTYWTPGQQPEIRLKSQADYVALLREHLEMAVAGCLRSAFPIGAHLSGGLDSTSIAVLASRQLRAQGKALAGVFSWSPPPGPAECPLPDERALIEEVCQREALICHYTNLTPDDVVAELRRDISVEPSVALYYEVPVRRVAAAQGMRTLLSGWGGDEAATFNGHGYLAELLLRGRWPTLLQAMRQHSQLYNVSLWALLKSQVLLPLLPDFIYARYQALPPSEHRPELPPQVHQLLTQNLRRTRPRPGVRRNQRQALANGHLTQRIETWANDAASSALEYRYPLLDRRLLDVCLALPAEQFLHQGWKRGLFRYAVADLLPASIGWRTTKREVAVAAMMKAVYWQGRQSFLAAVATGLIAWPPVAQIDPALFKHLPVSARQPISTQ